MLSMKTSRFPVSRSRVHPLALSVAALLLAACGEKPPGKPAAPEGAPAASAPAAAPAGAVDTGEEKVLNVYNWSDYIDPTVLEGFTRETGIKVNYDVFDSNEVLETKLLAGTTGYDVVVPSASFLERQIKAGVFRKLDKSKLPNLANLDPELQQRMAGHDPGNEYGVIYMWGTTGIGYNRQNVAEPVDSWGVMFDEKHAGRILMLDDMRECFAVALKYLGRSLNETDPAVLAQAAELLKKAQKVKPRDNVQRYLEKVEQLARVGRS